jgi:hypothetical protein
MGEQCDVDLDLCAGVQCLNGGVCDAASGNCGSCGGLSFGTRCELEGKQAVYYFEDDFVEVLGFKPWATIKMTSSADPAVSHYIYGPLKQLETEAPASAGILLELLHDRLAELGVAGVVGSELIEGSIVVSSHLETNAERTSLINAVEAGNLTVIFNGRLLTAKPFEEPQEALPVKTVTIVNVICGHGTYQDEAASGGGCKPCPEGTTHGLLGETNSSSCRAVETEGGTTPPVVVVVVNDNATIAAASKTSESDSDAAGIALIVVCACLFVALVYTVILLKRKHDGQGAAAGDVEQQKGTRRSWTRPEEEEGGLLPAVEATPERTTAPPNYDPPPGWSDEETFRAAVAVNKAMADLPNYTHPPAFDDESLPKIERARALAQAAEETLRSLPGYIGPPPYINDDPTGTERVKAVINSAAGFTKLPEHVGASSFDADVAIVQMEEFLRREVPSYIHPPGFDDSGADGRLIELKAQVEFVKDLPGYVLPPGFDDDNLNTTAKVQVVAASVAEFLETHTAELTGQSHPVIRTARFGFDQDLLSRAEINRLKARATPEYRAPPGFDADKAVEQIEELLEAIPGYQPPQVDPNAHNSHALELARQVSFVQRVLPSYHAPPSFDADLLEAGDDQMYETTAALLSEFIHENAENLPGYQLPPTYKSRRGSAEEIFHLGYDTATMMRRAKGDDYEDFSAHGSLYQPMSDSDLAEWAGGGEENYMVLQTANSPSEELYEAVAFTGDVEAHEESYLSTHEDETPF